MNRNGQSEVQATVKRVFIVYLSNILRCGCAAPLNMIFDKCLELGITYFA